MSLLLPLLAAAAVQPIAYPTFPAGRDFTAVARWLERESGVPRRDLVAVQDDMAWIRTPGPAERVPGQPVAMHVETVGAEAWKRLGGRSATVFLDADCQTRRVTVRSADVYAASNLLGSVRKGVEAAAVPASPDALAAVAIGLCGAPPALTAALAAAAAAPEPATTPPPARPPAPSRPPQQVAQAAPPPPQRVFRPIAPAEPTRPAPQPEPARAPEPAPVRVAAAPPPRLATPAQPPARTPEPTPPQQTPNQAAAAGPTVQIGAFGSSGAAMAAFGDLAASQPRLVAGKLQRLEPVAVQGGQLYRAVLTGFAGEAEAQAFCKALTAAGRPCVVRPAP